MCGNCNCKGKLGEKGVYHNTIQSIVRQNQDGHRYEYIDSNDTLTALDNNLSKIIDITDENCTFPLDKWKTEYLTSFKESRLYSGDSIPHSIYRCSAYPDYVFAGFNNNVFGPDMYVPILAKGIEYNRYRKFKIISIVSKEPGKICDKTKNVVLKWNFKWIPDEYYVEGYKTIGQISSRPLQNPIIKIFYGITEWSKINIYEVFEHSKPQKDEKNDELSKEVERLSKENAEIKLTVEKLKQYITLLLNQ